MLNVTLIFPFDPYSPTSAGIVIQPPLGLACIAATARAEGHRVTVIDGVGAAPEQHWSFRERFWQTGLTIPQILARIPANSDVIGFSLMFSQVYPTARELVRQVRERHPRARIIIGGEGLSGIARDVIVESGADAIVVGEGERPFAQFLRRVAAGEPFDDLANLVTVANTGHVLIKPSATAEKDVALLPRPDWSDINLPVYWEKNTAQGPLPDRRFLPFTASRGCAFRCKFCTSPATWGFQRYREVDDVIDEMRALKRQYGIQGLLFQDLSISTDIRWFEDFVEKLASAELGLFWMMPAGIRAQKLDYDILSTAKRSGFVYLQLAPETGSEKVMQWIEKRFSHDSVRDTVVAAKKVGLPTGAFFIVGHPVEDFDDYRDTVRFAMELARLGLDEIGVANFTLLPGSPYFNELRGQGKITLDDDFYANLAEGDMGAEYSNSPNFTGEEVKFLRLHLYLAFVAAKLGAQPDWALRSVANVFARRQETRLQRALSRQFGTVLRAFAPVASPASLRLAGKLWAPPALNLINA